MILSSITSQSSIIVHKNAVSRYKILHHASWNIHHLLLHCGDSLLIRKKGIFRRKLSVY